jgi:hypothetical protein
MFLLFLSCNRLICNHCTPIYLFLLLSAPRLHHQYRDEEKLLVLEEGKQLHNMSAAARNHHIPISTVMGWEAEIHQGHPPGHVRAEGGGRHPTLTNEQEELLLAFIQDRRKQHLMVGVSDVCNKAIELHKDPKFKASYHWANDFLKKHHLALHLTHSIHKTAALPVGQNMVLPQSILIQQMWEVSRFLRNRFGLDSAHIANADETHVPFESHPVHCIDEKNPQEPVTSFPKATRNPVAPCFCAFLPTAPNSLLWFYFEAKRRLT